MINYGPFSEDKTFEIFRQIVDAVAFLHKNGVAHRDIKLENILWTESSNELKLTDFGLAKSVSLSDVEFMSTPCGTPSYVAPEIIKGQNYTQAVDLWALGVVLYLLYVTNLPGLHLLTTLNSLFCKYPFPGDSLGEIYARIETGKVCFPAEIEISAEVKDLICNLLKEDTHSRFTLEDVFRHPWYLYLRCTILHAQDASPLVRKEIWVNMYTMVESSNVEYNFCQGNKRRDVFFLSYKIVLI